MEAMKMEEQRKTEEGSERKGLVYIATNLVNGKQYVGQTVRKLWYRIRQHFYDCESEKNHYYFHRALIKYGRVSFSWEILENNIPESLLNDKEIFYVAKYGTFGGGYNLTSGGGVGRRNSEETLRKQAFIKEERYRKNRMKYNGCGVSPETKEKMSVASKKRNITISAEKQQIMQAAKIIKGVSLEARLKMSAAHSGERHHMFGKKHSEEYKAKESMSQHKRGVSKNNASGFKGVRRKCNKWEVDIKVKGTKIYIGRFEDVVDAAKAYDAKAIELYGEENVMTNKKLGLY
jgi:group I intron endonuclease